MSEEQELLNQKPETESTAAECPPDRSFKMRIGGSTYVVGLYYSKTSHKSFEDRVRELMDRDMQKNLKE
ncbi:MAG: transposon-encoded TnpW family protein [Lachnospiraceae bacterium]|nr:transposon-encoded TnpW family protein [Lachnospiraceae bacterium]